MMLARNAGLPKWTQHIVCNCRANLLHPFSGAEGLRFQTLVTAELLHGRRLSSGQPLQNEGLRSVGVITAVPRTRYFKASVNLQGIMGS